MFTNCLEKVATFTQCEKCRFVCSSKKDWNRHILTRKHILNISNIAKKPHCNFCDYSCSKKSDYTKHILTQKHIRNIKVAENTQNVVCLEDTRNKNIQDISNKSATKLAENTHIICYECACGKQYKCKQSLYVHKKKCTVLKEDKTDLVLELLKQNQEFQKLLLEQNNKMMELATNHQAINNTINSNNTINQKFNLNVFLNETCKDALNINEFVNSLQISLTDTERVGTEGFVEGISRIFLNGLKQLDVCKRPIHCSDLKRETMHVKDNNIWIKEEEDTPKIVNAVKLIACKNVKSIPEWKKAYPECRDSESKKSDQYLQILQHSLGACDKEKDQESYLKVAKKIAKGTVIPRSIGQ